MKRIYLTLLLQCLVIWAFAQCTLKGTVKNTAGERLAGANLILNNSFSGTTTNLNGAYQFKDLKAGNYQITISYIGYEKQSRNVKITEDQTLDFVLKQDVNLTEEVLVAANRIKEKTPMASSAVDKSDIRANSHGQDSPDL